MNRSEKRPVRGWRCWMLDIDGHLGGMATQPALMWPAGTVVTAVCYAGLHEDQDAPAPDCECGLRVLPDLADMLEAIRTHPATLGIHPLKWMLTSRAILYGLNRAQHGCLKVPDVIGQMTAWGAMEPGYAGPGWTRCDPPGTLRAEHARVGRVLHLSAHLAHMAPALRRRYPRSVVRVGEARGLPWLDEIAAVGDQVDNGGRAA